jgi:natural product biosynthesis luciferase-like monooxygenase protein
MKFAAYAMPSFDESFGLTQGEFLRRTVDQLVSAEAHGYDSVWVNEHHFHRYGGLMPSLPTMLAAVAQRTTKLRLGTSVVVLPLHHPLEIAEQLAMVDLLSGGRLEFGVGRGFVAHDYEVMGVPYGTAQARLMESLEVIRQAWLGEPFTYHGTYYDFDDVQVWPRPEQQPHPPIWIACSNTPANFAWVGTQGYNLMTIGYTKPIEATAALTQIFKDAWTASGHDRPMTIATHYHVVVAEDRAEARRIAEAGLAEHVLLNRASRYLAKLELGPEPAQIPIAQLVDEGRLIAGDPDDCVRLLRRVGAEIGTTETHCLFQFGNITFANAQRSLELFAREVMPHLASEAVHTGT